MTELFRHTNTLLKLRADPELVPHRVKMLTERDGFPPTWYSSLMHAALFYRPVIVSMITEWSKHAVKAGHRKLSDVLTDFDDILFHELQRVTSGREFPSVMVGKQTSFEGLPLLGCLANYTLNLITLRVASSDAEFIFDERRFGAADRRPRAWDRLVHLWKSWFSPDALNALNSIFTAQRDGETVRLRRSATPSLPITGGRIETITNVALAVGDDIELALIGALVHDPLKRAPITLERARRAAVGEELGIEDEILLRELWIAARSKVDSATRREFFERCVNAIEKNRGLNLGSSIDLIRAFGLLGAPLLHRELIFRTMHPPRLPSLHPGTSDEIRTFSTVVDLLTNIDERIPFVGPDFLIPDELDADRVSDLLERLSVNSAIALLIRNLPRSSGLAKKIVAMLAERTKGEKYVSRVSPHLALVFLRRTARSAGQAEGAPAPFCETNS